MLTDGAHRKKGKFIKKDSLVYNKIKVERYNFSEIRKYSVLYPDNQNYNIIHERLHDPEEIDATIKSMSKIDDDLMSKNQKAPVIFPRDFTSDWMEEKRKTKKRNAHKDIDDDEFEMAMEEEDEEEREQLARSKAAMERNHRSDGKNKQESDKNPADEAVSSDHSSGDQKTKSALEDLHAPQLAESSGHMIRIPPESIEKAGAELRKFNQDLSYEDKKQPETLTEGLLSEEAHDESHDQSALFSHQDKIPSELNPEKSTHSSEDSVYETFDSSEVTKKSYNEGYQAAMKEAEENIRSSIRKEYEEQFHTLTQAAGQLENLRKDILVQAQDNFLEIVGALSEAVFDKVLKIDPASVKAIVNKAIVEGMDRDHIKIRMNPDLFESSEHVFSEDDHIKVLRDDALKKGEIMIESGDITVRNTIKDMITQMLSTVDLELYEASDDQQESEKAE